MSKGALLQGTLDLLVLQILSSGPKHGFAISRRLSELSREWLQVDEGSLYPCLYRMEERGYVSSKVTQSENNRRARYYTITGSGREELRARAENWRQLVTVVSTVMKKG
jgi:transcriptional regulator